jgi:hypothetical protein
MEESRVVIVTILTTIVWLSVTLLTPNQSNEVRLKMMPILESRIQFVKRLCMALILGVFVLLVVEISWGWILG